MLRLPFASLLAVSTLALAACAKDQGAFPSLARRPAERLNTPVPEATPSPVPTPAAADPALLARIAALEAKARAAHDRFTARTPQARTLVAAAAGAAVASEGWSVATIALSELEATRSESMIALADLDALYARAEVDGTDSAALAKARAEVVALVGAEDRVLGELQGQLAD
jgi:hypothetical protein